MNDAERFTRIDPARDGWNHYAYVGGNPLTYIDPTGMWRTSEERKADRAERKEKNQRDRRARQIRNETSRLERAKELDTRGRTNRAARIENRVNGRTNDRDTKRANRRSKNESDCGDLANEGYDSFFLEKNPVLSSALQAINVPKHVMGLAIRGAGMATGLLGSQFERRMSRRYWYSDGSDYHLSEGEIGRMSDYFKNHSGTTNFYKSPEFNGAIGGIGQHNFELDPARNITRFDDTYDFDSKPNNFNGVEDPGERSQFGERATRATSDAGRLFGANTFDIVYP